MEGLSLKNKIILFCLLSTVLLGVMNLFYFFISDCDYKRIHVEQYKYSKMVLILSETEGIFR